MSNDTKYNGWTNYETWRQYRVFQEIFDLYSNDAAGMFAIDENTQAYDLSQKLKDYIEEIVAEGLMALMADYASAFLDAVNWLEIADKFLADFSYCHATDETEEV